MKRGGRIGEVLPFPYDWRLSNRYNGRRLAQVIGEALSQWRDSDPARAEAQVVLVCHSMGGLVARWYVEECGGAEVTRKVITLGTPYRGSAKAIDQLVNGVRYGLGPLAFEFTEFARSMPSSYQLLPDYACVEAAGSLHRLDEIVLPSLNTTMLRDSIRFHRQLAANDGSAAANATHVIIGTQQPTWTTAHPTVNGAQLQDTIGDDNDFGDATVPLVGAIGFGLPMDTNRVSRFSEIHGQLQSNQAVLDEIEAIISAKPVRRRDTGSVSIGLRAPEMVVVGDPVSVSLDLHLNGNARTPSIALEFERQETDGSFTTVTRRLPDVHNRPIEVALNVRDPGAYRLRVTGATTGAHVAPVTTNVLVWPNT
jgi:pimeloyl-ACP methyl ester carboxylesterase